MENSVASLEDFEFLEFEESDQKLAGLSHCEFIDASDGIGSDRLIVTDSISHIRRHHIRLDDHDDDDEGEDDDGYGLDDELVPWSPTMQRHLVHQRNRNLKANLQNRLRREELPS
ncbi:hypothetical protein M0R45_005794 [Rubus argutus]|uniref:Uncharacterized protein n=1 Tax=Rubus argutus TaxID=59490 RepID=A0AAW1YNT9_RUBAR